MDDDFTKRFMAAVRKGLTDEMIAEQMDLTLAEVRIYRRELFPERAADTESSGDEPES